MGVNLIYAVFYQLQMKESFFLNIAQELEKRLEIDYVEVRGPAFEGWDQRAILAHLVSAGLAEAVCFLPGGSTEPPIDVLHKKAVVLAPGSFEHLDLTHAEIHERLLTSAIEQLRAELDEKDPAPTGYLLPLRDAADGGRSASRKFQTCCNVSKPCARVVAPYCSSVIGNSTA